MCALFDVVNDHNHDVIMMCMECILLSYKSLIALGPPNSDSTPSAQRTSDSPSQNQSNDKEAAGACNNRASTIAVDHDVVKSSAPSHISRDDASGSDSNVQVAPEEVEEDHPRRQSVTSETAAATEDHVSLACESDDERHSNSGSYCYPMR